MGTISLCIIAKDEESMLPDLFESVKGAVDEIVFVDTGSQDATVQIASQAGARVFHQAWADDFSAARNYALAQARCDWILVLDCDERLAPGAAIALRQAVARDDFDLGRLPLHNASHLGASVPDVLSGKAAKGVPVLLPRLMRKDPTLRWTGRIHETVAEWYKVGPKRVTEIPAQIVHLGYAETVVDGKKKAERNLRILEKACVEQPENSVIWSHLARVHVNAGRTEAAWEAAIEGWAALEKTVASGDFSLNISPLVTAIAFLALKKDDEALALRVLDQAAEWGAKHPNLQLLRGACHVSQVTKGGVDQDAVFEEAIVCFGKAIQMGEKVWDEECMPGATSWAAWTRIGSVRLLQDRWEEAYAAFAQALADKGDHLEAALGIVEAQLGLEDPVAALRTLEPLLKADLADPWILGAFASRNLGQIEDCKLFLRMAFEKMDVRILAPHRRKYFRLLQEDLAAVAV
jgi:tetratricopeptide (TPR) repeat protein